MIPDESAALRSLAPLAKNAGFEMTPEARMSVGTFSHWAAWRLLNDGPDCNRPAALASGVSVGLPGFGIF